MSASWYARIVDGNQTGIESAAYAANMARMAWVQDDGAGGLRWTTHDPGTRGAVHGFRLIPISDDEAAAWRERHPRPEET